MKVKNVLLGAATAMIPVGSLLGVGCKSSGQNAAATMTSQMQETPAQTSTVSQTQTTATYTIVLKVGPAEDMLMPDQATNAGSGEVMVQMPNMPVPVTSTTDPEERRTVNHHVEVHIFNKTTGAAVTDVVPAIAIRFSSTNVTRYLDIVEMYDAAVGATDIHFGNNLYQPDGLDLITVTVGAEAAQFNVTVSDGAPPAIGTETVAETPTERVAMTPAPYR